MKIVTRNADRSALLALQQFVRKPAAQAEEFCELCAAPLPAGHQHLLELEKRRIVCACEPCTILFDGMARQPYKRIPRRVSRLDDFRLDDFEWESLLIPINLAFFVHSTAAGRVEAQYPSPGGAMDSSLEFEYWDAIVQRNPLLRQFEPDVEALLVNRVSQPARYYRAPIDQCYRLVGILRTKWHGLSGGAEVWTEIENFFSEMDRACGGKTRA
jgi:hypothetical protein